MYEVNGSNALKNEYITDGSAALKEEPRRPARRPAAKTAHRKRGLTGERKAFIFMTVLIVSAMAAMFLTLTAMLNTGYRNLSQKKDQLSALEAKVEQLTSETEGAAVVTATEEQAAEMGLYKASRDQVVYISLDGEDGGEVLAEDDSNEGLNAFFNKVAAIAEYFY